MRVRIHIGLLIFAVTFGGGGFVTGIISFTVLRADVQALTRQVARLDSDRDTIVRHEAELAWLKKEVARQSK